MLNCWVHRSYCGMCTLLWVSILFLAVQGIYVFIPQTTSNNLTETSPRYSKLKPDFASQPVKNTKIVISCSGKTKVVGGLRLTNHPRTSNDIKRSSCTLLSFFAEDDERHISQSLSVSCIRISKKQQPAHFVFVGKIDNVVSASVPPRFQAQVPTRCPRSRHPRHTISSRNLR